MRPLVVAVIALVLLYRCGDSAAIEMAGDKAELSESDKRTLVTCRADNPCAVWSLEEFRVLLTLYRARLMDGGSTCRRNIT